MQEKLHYCFQDEGLIETAMSHSSYANERHCQSNERLEFLGDSILGMVTAEWLYRNYPDLTEGKMTRLRAELVCEASLYDVANRLLLGHGEELSGGRQRQSILADCVEAVIAALYLDGGFEVAKGFIQEHILSGAENIPLSGSGDYKTDLQELIQQNPGHLLSYVMTGETGPNHNKTFTFAAVLNGETIGEGEGRTKKEAEQNAARSALNNLETSE